MKKLLTAALLGLALASCGARAPDVPSPNDPPRYAWRALHIDVARHYFDLATLKRLVDLEAHLNLNVLHVHFTDDSAWRLPSAAYPRLTSAQHYTPAELRALIAYAQQRNVTIVPEVDLPAHSGPAIRAYPGLACGSTDELCPTSAQRFADTVVAEAVATFPSPWIHLGGDEVSTWSKAQRRAFQTHMVATLRRAHRTAVVWDDEADVAPRHAIVMVWHLGDAAVNAIASGHRVIMASDGPLYFNAAQGDSQQEPPASRYVSTLEQVYAFSTPREDVLGLEATLWTEKIATPQQLWYMLLPRAIALAEIAAIPPERKNWKRFYRTLPEQLAWLDAHGFPYRIPNVMLQLRDGSARFESVRGNINAATAYVTNETQLTAEDAASHAAVFVRINGGRWQSVRKALVVAPGETIDAFAEWRERRSAITTLYVKRARAATGARSRSFDAVVSP